MVSKKFKRYAVLSILFFLPVVFLLMLIPAQHNYVALDIVKENVYEAEWKAPSSETIQLKDKITVLGFLGQDPMGNVIETSNLKELIYDKFRGFKNFQIVLVASEGTEGEVEKLKENIIDYQTLEFLHFVQSNSVETLNLYSSLNSKSPIKEDLSTSEVFIIDKELNQRGRLVDREENNDSKKGSSSLPSYNTLEVAEIKNKMSEDMRVLFTEYRQKRKGDFNSTVRRAEDLGNTNGN
ncbi:MAG: hypothetical protein R3213_00140 [Flavobacteriaceae bacterium]|nr:hypothetical protein [Flavobacteriaceae bacterium]